jgi:hemerythrin-like domain-containing protein
VKQSLNELVKHLRHDRGLTLNDLNVSWSTATMSRFEHGDIELADEVVAQIAVPLGLDYEDLISRHILSEESLDNWICLASESWDGAKAADLLQHLDSLKVEGARNGFLRVVTAVIEQLIAIHEHGRQNMGVSVVKMLDKYLSNLDEFSRLEGFVFSVCSEYVPVVKGWTWVSRQVEMVKNKGMAPQRIRRLISYCSGVAERAAIEHEFGTMSLILTEIRELDALIPENAKQRYNLKSLEALYADLTVHSTDTHAQFVKIVQAGKMVFSSKIHQGIVRYTIAQGWTSVKDFYD